MWFQSSKNRKPSRKPAKAYGSVLHVSGARVASPSVGVPYGGLILLGGVILVVAAWGIWLLLGSFGRMLYNENPRFALQEIKASTDGVLPSAILVEWSGVQTGENLFNLDLEAIRRRLERNSVVRSAWVRRELPGTLFLRINERVPIARMGQVEGRMNWLMDAEGVVIKKSFQAKHLPFLLGVTRNVMLGDNISDTKAKDALAYLVVLREMHSAKRELFEVQVISVGHPAFLDFRLADGTQVLLPRGGDPRKVLEQTTRLIHEARLRGRETKFFDLRPEGSNKIGAPR